MPCLKDRKAYPIPSKEELEQCYNELKSLKLCSVKFGVSYECFRTWLKTSNIPIGQQGVNTKPINKKSWSIK